MAKESNLFNFEYLCNQFIRSKQTTRKARETIRWEDALIKKIAGTELWSTVVYRY